jgi:hypothetical protein
MVSDRTVAVIGRIILAIGIALIFASGGLAGALAWSGSGGDEGEHDVTHAALLPGALWAVGGFVLWRAGRSRLFGLSLAVAIAGYALGAIAIGDLDAGGSADSMADIGLVVGGFGSLIGLLITAAGARLARPPALPR